MVTTNKLLSLPEYRDAKRIGIYLSMPFGELSTTSLVRKAFTDGKEVYVPYLHSMISPLTQQKTSVMDMLALHSFEEFQTLEPDGWGIPSLKQEQVVDKKNGLGGHGVSGAEYETTVEHRHGIDLIIMPGMAFDYGFRRLGHGKGYYDDFLMRYLEKEKSNSNNGIVKMPFLGK